MADMMEYKCPSCGGAMEFDSTTQKMKCPYCDTEMEVAQYQQMQEKAEGNAGGNQGGDAGGNNENWSDMGNNQWMEGETDGIRVYVCQSCGGEIVADANTGATSCPVPPSSQQPLHFQSLEIRRFPDRSPRLSESVRP